MSDLEITFTASVPPLWSDDRISAYAAQAGNPRQAAAMRSAALRVRNDYEAERLHLLQRITWLEQVLNDVVNSQDK